MIQSLTPSPLSSYQPLSGIPTFKTLLCLPLLYGMCIPLFSLDIGLSLYHWIVFPVLGIKRVERAQYIRIDRHREDVTSTVWVYEWRYLNCGEIVEPQTLANRGARQKRGTLGHAQEVA